VKPSSTVSRTPCRRNQVSSRKVSSYSGVGQQLPAGTVTSTRCRWLLDARRTRPRRSSPRSRSWLGELICRACSARPGTSSDLVVAPVAITSWSYGSRPPSVCTAPPATSTPVTVAIRCAMPRSRIATSSGSRTRTVPPSNGSLIRLGLNSN
jgi:hypothetical protein